MENVYSNSVILDLCCIYGESNRIISRTCRKFNEKYPELPPITNNKFRRIKSNFLKFGNVKAVRTAPKPVTDNENNEINVLAYFHANPQGSIPGASDDLGLCYSSIQRILKKHKMHNFSYQKVQSLRPEDFPIRTEFCEHMILRLQENPDILKRILWTDEAKFSKEGIFNRKNLHHWAKENPHVVRESNFQQRFSFNVFCIIMDDMVEYHVYEENLNGNKYVEILRTVVANFIDNLPLNIYNSLYYQMDGCGAHNTREVYEELVSLFQDRWFAYRGPWRWPARSPDLTPLDFYLWGKIKTIVYATPVTTKENLENRVRAAFQHLNAHEIRRATVNSVNCRILSCLEQNGGHFEHLL